MHLIECGTESLSKLLKILKIDRIYLIRKKVKKNYFCLFFRILLIRKKSVEVRGLRFDKKEVNPQPLTSPISPRCVLRQDACQSFNRRTGCAPSAGQMQATRSGQV